jgi:predicted enzyme related to lactoylglutathione lyase
MGLVYTSIRAKDLKKTLAFYTKLMGMKVTGTRSHWPGEKIVSLKSPDTGVRLTVMYYAKHCKLYTPWKNDGVELDHLMFEVKDFKKSLDKLVKSGAPIAMGPFESKERSMVMVKDPNGIWVGVMSVNKK